MVVDPEGSPTWIDVAESDSTRLRRHRAGYMAAWLLMVAVPSLALLEHWTSVPIFGVLSGEAHAVADGCEFHVEFPRVARPGLAAPLDFTVTCEETIDQPVVIVIDDAYLAMWDQNGLQPEPSSTRSDGQAVVWEFDPPMGNTLHVRWDARIEPAVQAGHRAQVRLVNPAMAVNIETIIRP